VNTGCPEDLLLGLKGADAEFDDGVGLLWGAVGPTRYHTRLAEGTPVHPTRESMVYAASLLETDEIWRHERAARILDLLIDLQDADPLSPTLGIWPWYFEEPLTAMAPPDPNWADFLGVQIVRILRGRRPARTSALREVLGRASAAIRKRDVRLSYTNIALMGAYVCRMAGEILEDGDLARYGKKRLRLFADFTRAAGGFPEYNSPTYTVVALAELTRMLRDFSDDEDRFHAREIHDRAWEDIARNWHGPSRQWAGPHSRSYSTLLQSGTLGFLQRGLGRRIELTEEIPASLEWAGLPIRCPERLLPFFTDKAPRSDRRFVISRGQPDLEAHVHLEPEFALSSAERATFWNQARSLVAYAPAGGKAAALTVRFLHDGYDFCAANLLCVQEGGRVLAGVGLASDGGDVHGELDRIVGGRIRGSDWRLRFTFFHQDELPAKDGEIWRFSFGHAAHGVLRWLGGTFAGQAPIWEIQRVGADVRLDLILWRGTESEFVLDESFSFHAVFALALKSGDAPEVPNVRQTMCADHIRLDWRNLQLETPCMPLTEAEILTFARRAKTRRMLSLSHP
jgi:hypothetical protein